MINHFVYVKILVLLCLFPFSQRALKHCCHLTMKHPVLWHLLTWSRAENFLGYIFAIVDLTL